NVATACRDESGCQRSRTARQRISAKARNVAEAESDCQASNGIAAGRSRQHDRRSSRRLKYAILENIPLKNNAGINEIGAVTSEAVTPAARDQAGCERNGCTAEKIAAACGGKNGSFYKASATTSESVVAGICGQAKCKTGAT